MACLLTLCVVDGSSAFAKGGPMGHGPVVKNGRDFGRNNFRRFDRNFNRYGWNYGFYGYEFPTYETVAPVCETVAPVCTTCEPVVEPVVTTVAPTYVGYDYGFYGHKNFRHREHDPIKYRPLTNMGGMKGGMGRKG
jgi:hypothetical protein